MASSGILTTGTLVRHPKQDADIGQDKAEMAKKRPSHAHADRVSAPPRNITTAILADTTNATQHDLIIYAVASSAVTSRLEYGRHPPGHDARAEQSLRPAEASVMRRRNMAIPLIENHTYRFRFAQTHEDSGYSP